MIGLFNVLAVFALITAYAALREQQITIENYQQEVRERWESNPDKHPHRMAHYGYVAFRQPYPLSFFDRGVDSYTGNAVFLEAHRQNTVNFSTASFSTGLLQFGELSGALLLQVLLPLLVFFWGFSVVAGEREDGMLRLVFAQGATWPEVIIGKAVGLFCAALTVLLPALLLTVVLLGFTLSLEQLPAALTRYALLLLSYGLYILIVSLLTVWISAVSKTAKVALLRLIGCWLLFVLVLPKVSQVAGQVLIPSPSKVAFDRAVQDDLLKQGDSHNPDDPYFQGLKDSVLSAYQVASTKELPFNYAGFVMREGEKLSTETFRRHQRKLLARYDRQQSMVRWTGFINPYVALKYISMALAGTNFHSYRGFTEYAEEYRYHLAQTMNNLQIEHIGNNVKTSADKSAVLDRSHWQEFDEFKEPPKSLGKALRAEGASWLALFLWAGGLTGLAYFSANRITVI